MGSQNELLEDRLKSFINQLQTEYGILDRMVYKNKNQHRRCSYFQYVLKVRRDLRLLRSADLGDILGSCFMVINGKKPTKKVNLLESLKRRKCDFGKYNFMEQLLGAARLLSQMVEPILKAATGVSTLFAQSFFLGFSVTILALLARIRVLVQQILLDVVSVFNMVSSISQKEQSVRLTRVEIYRDYYPKNEEVVTLECEWKTDKFILFERIVKSKIETRDGDIGVVALGESSVQYESIEAFLGEDDLSCKKVDTSCISALPDRNDCDSLVSTLANKVHGKQADDSSGSEDSLGNNKQLFESCMLPSSIQPTSSSLKLKDDSSQNGVAFLSVKIPAVSAPPKVGEVQCKKPEITKCDDEDPFFNLLTSGNMKGSLF